MTEYSDPSKHLKKILIDQPILGINRLQDTLKNQPDRPWFAGQNISPVVIMGQFNRATGRLELSGGLQTIVRNVTSAASATLTCPAGHRYRVRFVSGQNNTRAVQWIFEHYASDGVTVGESLMGAAAVPIGNIQIMVGTPIWVDTNVIFHPALATNVILEAGENITTTAIGFVAADDMAVTFVYDDITLEG